MRRLLVLLLLVLVQASAAGASTRDADVLLRSGHTGEAVPILLQALAEAERAGDAAAEAEARLGLGRARFLLGEPKQALESLERALELAEETRRDDLAAAALNDLGNAASARGEQRQAMADFLDALDLAASAGLPLLAAEAAINGGRAALALDERARAADLAGRAAGSLEDAAEDGGRALAHLALGNLLRDLGGNDERLAAYHQYRAARRIGEALGDQATLAQAHGYLGELYERERRLDTALDHTGRALSAALAIDRGDILYRLQWQAGRLLRDLGREDEAIAAYRQAVQSLQGVRADLAASPLRRRLSFREFVGDLYYQLADLLLRRSGRAGDPDPDGDLLAARETIEQLKAVELEDYFQDECVTALKEKKVTLDREIDRRTAALYPIILGDRLELLLSLPDRIRRVTVPVDASTLTREARALRESLESYRGRGYLSHARRLYDWLVGPWEAELRERGIDTLVFLPDGALRLIPLAALHDGERFLVERYAIATSPGLILTDPKPLGRDSPRVLLGGLSEAVQGFQALPSVREELEAIRGLFGGRVIRDDGFVKPRIRDELEEVPYSIVHIATHGEIEADVTRSYLLTYDSRLTMDELEEYVSRSRYRVKGVELLTLSACRTAVGDDRAALGLAGIALKAGARSAMATLWNISDAATSRLVADFYGRLADTGVSKARALQLAQQGLLGDREYAHPGFWAPFLLIGNWM